MSNILEDLSKEILENVMRDISAHLRREMSQISKENFKPVYSEKEVAELLNVSTQTLARKRKDDAIDYALDPAGRPVYMVHHIYDYFLRNEVRNGKQTITLTDVIGSNVINFQPKKAA